MIDAGANIGAMSLPLACIPGISILAVEPGPLALERLRFNIAANGFSNVRVAAVALSGANGTVMFSTQERDIGLSGVPGGPDEQGTIEVAAKSFAALLADSGIQGPYVLKIDVEHHEDQILMPFFSTAPRSHWPSHVLIETLSDHPIPRCVTFMLSNGYRKSFETRQNTGLSLAEHAADIGGSSGAKPLG